MDEQKICLKISQFGGIMVQEIEIEYKVLLTKEEYERLASNLPFPTHSLDQTNYYFETENFDFKKYHSALRIREKNQEYTLTFKQPHQDGILETHDQLREKEFVSWINEKPISKPNVAKQLDELNFIIDRVRYFGSLKTKRKTFMSDDIIYVLDESFYNGKVDYELEIEAPSRQIGSIVFTNLLKKHNISPKEPITKIERFFNTL